MFLNSSQHQKADLSDSQQRSDYSRMKIARLRGMEIDKENQDILSCNHEAERVPSMSDGMINGHMKSIAFSSVSFRKITVSLPAKLSHQFKSPSEQPYGIRVLSHDRNSQIAHSISETFGKCAIQRENAVNAAQDFYITLRTKKQQETLSKTQTVNCS